MPTSPLPAALLLLLAGCGGQEQPTEPQPQPTQPQPQPTQPQVQGQAEQPPAPEPPAAPRPTDKQPIHRPDGPPAPPTIAERQEVRDEVRDRSSLKAIVSAWTRAWKSGDEAAEKKADQRLFAWLNNELREDTAEVKKQKRQAAAGEKGGARDVKREKADLRRTRAIARELKAMQPKFESGKAAPADYQKKHELLLELQKLAAREVRAARQEAKGG